MSELNIGKVIVDTNKTSQVVVNYADTTVPDTSTITSNRSQMVATVDSIARAFEVSTTYYFDCDGSLSLTDEGCGVLGTTDSSGKLTVSPLTPTLTLDSPLESAKFELDETITVEWTANNITLINIVIESATGIKTVENVDATLGTYDVDLTPDTGDFEVNQEITITVENVIGAVADSVDISSIATITMTTPVLTAGTEGTITGTHNGGTGYFVQVQYRVASPEGAWTTFENNVPVEADGTWEATGTVALAETYDFRARDTVDPDGQIQLDDVAVASGVSSSLFLIDYNGTASDAIRGVLISDGSTVSGVASIGAYNFGSVSDLTLVYDKPNGKLYSCYRDAAGTDAGIVVSDGDYNYVDVIGSFGSGNGQLQDPRGVCFDDDYIYVSDYVNQVITKFNKSTYAYVSKTASIGYSIQGLVLYDGLLYVVSRTEHKIRVYNASTMAFVTSFGANGTSNGQFNFPRGVCVDADYVYVSDTNNHRIQKFSRSNYDYVSKFGTSGGGDSNLSSPQQICTEDGKIYIADSGNKRCMVITTAMAYSTKYVWDSSPTYVPYGISLGK
jgi:hypothetical protein